MNFELWSGEFESVNNYYEIIFDDNGKKLFWDIKVLI